MANHITSSQYKIARLPSGFRVGGGFKMTQKIGLFKIEKGRWVGQKSLKIVERSTSQIVSKKLPRYCLEIAHSILLVTKINKMIARPR